MPMQICPRCRSRLTENIIEYLEPQEDEGVKIHTFDAYVCECGYMKHIESVPEVIAQEGDDRLLLLYRGDQARILDVRDSVIWPPMHVQSILGRGYWDEYRGHHDVASLVKNARDSRAYDLKSPNFFHISSVSSSIDISFFIWLVSWSLKVYEDIDNTLHQAAVHLVSQMFISHGIPLPVVHSLEFKHMFNGFDMIAIINDQYAFLIRNHPETMEQNNFKTIKDIDPDLICLSVYYGNKKLDQYVSREFISIDQTKMISILQEGKDKGVQNQIYIDYLTHLQSSSLTN